MKTAMAIGNFKSQPLRQQKTIGEQLRQSRMAMDLTLKQCASTLKISESHLLALEEGRYADMPSPVFIKNYLQLYARLIGISWSKIEEQYAIEVKLHHAPQSAANSPDGERVNTHGRMVMTSAHGREALLIPTVIKGGVIGIVVMVVALYFVWQVVQFLSPPDLVVTSPSEDVIVEDPRVIIEGQTEPEALVEINAQPVAVNQDGTFAEEIFVHGGLNVIRVTAHNKQSGERVEVRNILYNDAEEQRLREERDAAAAVLDSGENDGSSTVTETLEIDSESITITPITGDISN